MNTKSAPRPTGFFQPRRSTPPPPPLPEEPWPEFVRHPDFSDVTGLCVHAGTAQKARPDLDKFHVELLDAHGRMAGHSLNDSRLAVKRQFALLIADKLDPEKAIPAEVIIQKDHFIRRIAKRRASEISRKACLVAAEAIEAALPEIESYVKKLADCQNTPFMPNKTVTESTRKKFQTTLTDFAHRYVAFLRSNQNPMVSPKSLLS